MAVIRLMKSRVAALLLVYAGLSLGATAGEPVHHHLTVALQPSEGRITVTDRLSLPEDGDGLLRFQLAAGLEVQAEGGRLSRGLLPRGGLRSYELRPAAGVREVVLRYAGELGAGAAHPEHGMPDAAVGVDGVYLDGASAWYPRVGDALVTFELEVQVPPGWEAISQGRREAGEAGIRWVERLPQDDIYLVAGPFSRYADHVGLVATEVYLLEADESLARRYLDALARYLPLYEGLLGPYPYAKFAVVENRWETGYGMPSFTLLGSRVMRLPFILDSSLPHELLHNWWGNGVYVDARDGNWSEGLTAYLSDYLIQEARGQGVEYRRGALQRYESFAAERRDAPLRSFRARHDEASQAVGYGKSLMLFHMLRGELGDATFLAALRDFATRWMSRPATFTDLFAAFAQAAGKDLASEQDQWLERAGAPALRIAEAQAVASGDGRYRLTVRLSQVQDGEPFRLDVPVAVTLRDAAQAQVIAVSFTGDRSAGATVDLDAEPLRLDVDPGFDVFRRLAAGEVPPSLGTLFGSRRQLLVIPTAASGEDQAAWRSLAEGWARRYQGVEVVRDAALSGLPADRAVWVLGWDNRWAGAAARRLAADALDAAAGTARLDGLAVTRQQHAVVLAAPDGDPAPLGFIGAEGAPVIAALARKLPHYTRYGRLVFAGESAENVYKGERQSAKSALTHLFTAADEPRAPLPPGPILAPQAAGH
jgi:hypothetical protein